LKKKILPYALTLIIATATLATNGYSLFKKFPVNGAAKWDYLTVDDVNRRLYLSHESEVAVFDVDSGSAAGRIADTPGVHGIAIAPEAGRGFTSNGQVGSVTIFDLKSLAVISQVAVGKKPDAIIYDPATQRVFAMNGGSNSTSAIESATGKVAATVNLGGGPEFGAADGAGNVFVNLEDESETVHLDSRNLVVKDHWPLAPCTRPSSMAIDRASHRLFIGCRSRVMAVVNSDTGKVIATLPLGDHVDATAFDPETKLIFNSTGEGTVDVFHEDSPDQYSAVERISTHAGSKTMALDFKTHRLFVPAANSGQFEILVFAK
jgi:YVTN family beta-propeller protein